MQLEVDAKQVDAEPALLRDVAYNKLLSMIFNGTLPAGSVLQERRLAMALGLSRTPVREAMGRCEAEGLISFNANRSPTVRKLEVTEALEVFKVRKLLECTAARAAAEHGMSKSILTSARSAVARLVGMTSTKSQDHWTADDLVHGVVADASRNQLLAKSIRDARRRTRVFDTQIIPSRRAPGAAEHLAILDAIERQDPFGASSAMALHIENAKNSMLNKVVTIPRDDR